MQEQQFPLALDTDKKPTCIDIYCGAGGTTFGAQAAGLHVAYGLDRDPHAIRTFAKNHPSAYADLRDVAVVTAREILELGRIDHVDFLLSGPNCQAVSTMGLFWDGDPRNLLFVHLARLIDEFIALGKPPQNVVVENVPGIAFKKNVRIVQDLVQFFEERAYRCSADVVNFATWGLPQLRHRFILLATRADGISPSLPAPVASLESGDGLVTVWDAIGDLSPIDPVPAGKSAARIVDGERLTPYQARMRGGVERVYNHHEGTTAEIDRKRIRHVPPGGCWKDIPAELMPERFRRVRMTDYKTLYGRLLKDHPAYTIYAAFGNVTSGCFTHPEHDRPLTAREGLRLQGFPDDFVVVGSVASQYRQIGNAVPALAAEVLIGHWRQVLAGDEPDSVRPRLDRDLLFAGDPPKLPVLTPRYRLVGYGSGTYWPKGWGTEPSERLTAAEDYRISKDPIRYRRSDWRFRRDEKMAESLEAVETMDWSPLKQELNGSRRPVILLSDTQAGGGDQEGSELARRRFMRYLAPAGAAIASLAAGRRVLVHCDFGLTADWLHKFLGLLIESGQPLYSESGSGERAGDPSSPNRVQLITGATPGSHVPEDFDVLVVARPFAELPEKASRLVQDARGLTSPSERVEARQVRADIRRMLKALHA